MYTHIHTGARNIYSLSRLTPPPPGAAIHPDRTQKAWTMAARALSIDG